MDVQNPTIRFVDLAVGQTCVAEGAVHMRVADLPDLPPGSVNAVNLQTGLVSTYNSGYQAVAVAYKAVPAT